MSTFDLPGMDFKDALAAWISAHIKATDGVDVDPVIITDARIEHEPYYTNGDTDWPEENYVSYRILHRPDTFRRINIDDPNGAFLYDLLRIGLMTTLVERPDVAADAERESGR